LTARKDGHIFNGVLMKGIVVLSGGLDSSTLLHYVKEKLGYDEIYAITFDYSQKHSIEISCARWQAKRAGVKEHKILNISFLGEITKDVSALTSTTIKVPKITEVLGDPQPITYVPYRNLILLSICLAYAESVGADSVFYGAQKHDTYSGYWDASPEFLEAINRVSMLNRRHNIQIKAEFVNLSKGDVIKIGQELGVNYKYTWSCYNPIPINDEHGIPLLVAQCGECPTCSDRLKAFIDASIPDPQEYAKNINWNDLLK